MNITLLPLSLIDEDKDQPRYQFNEEALEELANSIKEIGLLSPIKVLKMNTGRYKIIYGNRRYKAATMVGLAELPCIISEATSDLDIYFEQIAENLTRQDFSPIEEAEAFDKVMNDPKFRTSIKLLSSKLGKPEGYIKNKCELLKFSAAVKKLIVSGTQIRKGFLVEDQLLPLKDLPLEYSNPIALIAAKDELPVSDVKKLAKMFKDSSVPEAVKEKLLLKDGRGLIDSWSVYEQNRKEKLAREKEKAEKAKVLAEARLIEESEQEQHVFEAEVVLEHESRDIKLDEQLSWQMEEVLNQLEEHEHAFHQPIVETISPEQQLVDQFEQVIAADTTLLSSIIQLIEQNNLTNPDYAEQLTIRYLSHIHQLEQDWKSVLKAIAIKKLDI